MQVPYYFEANFEYMPINLISQALDILAKNTKKMQKHISCLFSYTKICYDRVNEASKIYYM